MNETEVAIQLARWVSEGRLSRTVSIDCGGGMRRHYPDIDSVPPDTTSKDIAVHFQLRIDQRQARKEER